MFKRNREEDGDEDGVEYVGGDYENTAPKASRQKSSIGSSGNPNPEESEFHELDSFALKKMILSLEKKINKNVQARIKYPNNPEKYANLKPRKTRKSN